MVSLNKPSAGNTDWTTLINDNWTTIENSLDQSICQGRLTLTSGTAITTSDVTAATTLYFTPYQGNRIAVYDGTTWKIYSLTEKSLSLSGLAANTNFDIFIYDNAGTLTLEALAWTNGTTRATALASQDGIYVKSGATTRRYLGTIRTTGTIGQCEDSAAKRFLWNAYNRVPRALSITDTTNSWTYTTATWRSANSSTANRVEMVIGLSENPVSARTVALVSNSGAAVLISVASGIGIDSTSVNSATVMGTQVAVVESATGNFGTGTQAHSVYRGYPGIGYHYLQWLEISEATGTTTWYGDNNLTYIQSGLTAEVMG